jgi:hypothetical protein
MSEIKRLAQIAGLAVLAGLLASCGLGWAVSSAGGVGAVSALRDLSIIILALLTLVPTIIGLAVYFGLAFVVGKWGGKVLVGVGWVARKVAWGEGLVNSSLDRVAVRPVAKTARALTMGKQFVVASARRGERVSEFDRQSRHAVRTVTSLLRQLRNNPLGQAEH